MQQWLGRDATKNLAWTVMVVLAGVVYSLYNDAVKRNERIQAECVAREEACRNELRLAQAQYIQNLVAIQIRAIEIKNKADSLTAVYSKRK